MLRQFPLTNLTYACKIPIVSGAILKEFHFQFTYTCKLKISGNYLFQGKTNFTYQCTCQLGTHWDADCQDCVPDCAPQILSYLEAWNTSLIDFIKTHNPNTGTFGG